MVESLPFFLLGIHVTFCKKVLFFVIVFLIFSCLFTYYLLPIFLIILTPFTPIVAVFCFLHLGGYMVTAISCEQSKMQKSVSLKDTFVYYVDLRTHHHLIWRP